MCSARKFVKFQTDFPYFKVSWQEQKQPASYFAKISVLFFAGAKIFLEPIKFSKNRKHPTSQFYKYLFLGEWSPGKSYLFLKKIQKALLEILICSRTFCLSWKILCSNEILFLNLISSYVFFITSKPPGIFDVFQKSP